MKADKKSMKPGQKFLVLIAIMVVALSPVKRAQAAAFDFNTGSSPIEVIIPAVIPVVFSTVNPNDATLVLRTTTLLTTSWFDAIAPYGESSVGVYSRLGRRPESERTDANRNIAILHASYQMLMSLYPEHVDVWRGLLTGVGLDPEDTSVELTSAVGIGNAAGMAVVAARENDGMNQLGNERINGRIPVYGKIPYADYTGYEPVNSAYELKNPSRWQPAISTTGYGIFKVQQFVTPQFARTLPFSYESPKAFRVPEPVASMIKNRRLYVEQVNQVLEASANMTDEQKMMAELFDNKINSLGFSALFASISKGLTLEEFVWYDFLTNIAAYDTGIIIWQEKARYDAVRPFSAIKHIYKNRKVKAWGGPYQGTVNDVPASEWRSYLPVADHPEYPSGSSAFCAAHATSSRLFFGNDTLNWSFTVPQGSSGIEPGFTPQTEIQLSFATWTDFDEICGQTRFWAGVHFPASIEAGQSIGREIGSRAYQFLIAHTDETAPPHCPGRTTDCYPSIQWRYPTRMPLIFLSKCYLTQVLIHLKIRRLCCPVSCGGQMAAVVSFISDPPHQRSLCG